MTTKPLIQNTIVLANQALLIKATLEKVGLEYLAPLKPAVLDEKISTALNRATQEKKQ